MKAAACVAWALAMASPVAAAPPVAGDVYVYRVSNGYNNEVRGHLRYQVDAVDAGRVTFTVTPDNPSLGPVRAETYAADGNWLRHAVTNHDQPVEYEFSPALPVYAQPLEEGKSWSARVNATEPVSERRASIRVDGKVVGGERVTLPAGAFDTLKVRRTVYAGDWDGFRQPTTINEIDWYSPALGRTIRSESRSDYIDLSRGRGKGSQWTRGDWVVLELTEFTVMKP